MVDIAFPLKAGRSHPDTLRWVLRCAQYHLPFDRVFIATSKLPRWMNPDSVVFLYTPQESIHKHQNIGENLRAVLESDISEDFLWFNDDFFVLRDIDQVQLHHRDESYDDWYERCKDKARGDADAYNYFGGMLGQYELMRELGLPTHVTTDAHVPMPVNKARLKETLAVIPSHMGGHFRAVYGAGLPSTPLIDPKIKTPSTMPELDWTYASSNPASWVNGMFGNFVRNRYWRPSKFEL